MFTIIFNCDTFLFEHCNKNNIHMKKIIYIIPGYGENCKLVRYQKLAKTIETLGYTIKFVNPNWYKPISEQIFPIENNAIVLGFSFGAVIAYLVVKKYSCKNTK